MIMSFVVLLVFTITVFAPVAQAACQPTVLWGRNCNSAVPSAVNCPVDAKNCDSAALSIGNCAADAKNCDSAAPSVGNCAVDAKTGNCNDMINNILKSLGYTKSDGEQSCNYSFLTMPQFGKCILK